MIFVTVGTHEQPFNRLVQYMDEWASKHDEEVVIQLGFSTYRPHNCKWETLFPYPEMVEKVGQARIIITHGGPSSFIMPLQIGKIPVVVPRREAYNEHVNDHQVEFVNAVASRQKNIIVVNEIEELADILDEYDDIVSSMPAEIRSNNAQFCANFARIVDGLM